MKRSGALLVLALAAGLPRGAAGQPNAATKASIVEEARRYFDAGAKAYSAGKYDAAIQAFEQAYAISPRPGILFSIGQAYRRQYFLDKNPDNLRGAIDHYQKYVEAEPDGTRIPDAAAALSELEPLWARRGQGTVGESPLPSPKERTRLMITSPAAGAVVVIDDAEPKPLTGGQIIVEVAPGDHRVKVSAAGYFDEERTPTVPPNTLFPQDFPLRDKPAKLRLSGFGGADVSVDGRFVGTLPLIRPIDVEPGRHFVTVTASGYEPYAKEVDFVRGEEETLSAPLEMTGQRTFSYLLLVVSTVGLTTGVVFGAFALKEQNDATSIVERGEGEQLSVEDRLAYEDARVSRDELRRVAGITAGAGLAVGLLGGVLYLFDSPSVIAPPPSEADSPTAPSAPGGPPTAPEDTLDLSALPAFGPGYAGASIELRF